MIKEDLRIPDLYVPRVLDIGFEELAGQGRLDYILDLDNTLAIRDEELPQPAVEAKITHAQSQGWIRGLTIMSNVVFDRAWLIAGRSRVARVRRAAECLHGNYIACIFPILKPHPAPFLKAMSWMRSSPKQCVVVGDQISRDIVGGNRVGALSILVDPLGPDMWLTTIRRLKERGIRARLGASPGAT